MTHLFSKLDSQRITAATRLIERCPRRIRGKHGKYRVENIPISRSRTRKVRGYLAENLEKAADIQTPTTATITAYRADSGTWKSYLDGTTVTNRDLDMWGHAGSYVHAREFDNGEWVIYYIECQGDFGLAFSTAFRHPPNTVP